MSCVDAYVGIAMTDNIIAGASGESYFFGDTTGISGSNNLLFGAGAAPSFLTAGVTGDPLFVAAASP